MIDFAQRLLSIGLAAGVLWIVVGSILGGWRELWSTVDLSDNLRLTNKAMRDVDNGVQSALYCLGAILASVIFGVLAYHFDLSSSWEAMNHLRDEVKGTLGPVGDYGPWLLLVLTYAPTLMELYGARFREIFWMSVAAAGLALFDLFTDLPRVTSFMEGYRAFFVSVGNDSLIHFAQNVAFEGVYNLLFALWWFLASYGFELLFVVSAWCIFGFAVKAFAGAQRGAARQPTY